MNKSDLIEVVANKLHLPHAKAELVVNCIFDSMHGAMKKGERIEIRGFGNIGRLAAVSRRNSSR